MDALAIINKYYPEDNELKHILLAHSRSVADKGVMDCRKASGIESGQAVFGRGGDAARYWYFYDRC
jgi:hypothetical protein